ncbi:MAG: LamG domain-containing protein [Candidatus Omnitrophica bacterium]|nr:LamG domain-containing protein [Candidatus Omnitrophota bacterium]
MRSSAISAIIASAFGLLCNASAQLATSPDSTTQPITLNTDPALVAWWKLDEVTGQAAADSSKHAHHGRLMGGLSFDKGSAPGRIGGSLKFEGENGAIVIPNYQGVVGRQARTVAAWIKLTVPRGEIISWGTDDFGKMWTFGFIREHVGVTPKGGYLYMKAMLNDNAWHHVAAVLQEADQPNLYNHAKIFKDGELAEIDDIGLLDLWPIDTGSALEVRIGRGFKGQIDDVRVYNRALTEDEVNSLFRLETDRPLAQDNGK